MWQQRSWQLLEVQMKKRGTTICCVVCTTLSLLFLGLAIVILVLNEIGFFKEKVDDLVREQLTLEDGHQTYEQWVNPTIPMYKDFYVFNLTNPVEFAGGAKPHFDELGPYRYRERRVKTVLGHYDNGTIAYRMNRTFHFEQFGNFSEEDKITTINFVYVAALNTSEERGEAWLLKLLIEILIWPKPELLLYDVRAADLFWSYSDHFLQILHDLGQVTTDHINFQYNDSDFDRLHTSIIHSGERDSRLTAQLIQWAGSERLHKWRNVSDLVTGTEGIIWQPFLGQDKEIVAFISDTQSFRLRSNEKTSVLGINTYRFRVIKEEFQPNPDYWTYENITPDGLLYLGVLQDPRAPVFASKPHFLDCDPSLHSAVEGIRDPDCNVDNIFVDIEPITGSTLYVHQQLQVNIDVMKSSIFFPFHNINPPLYFPMFYIDEWAMIDEGLKSKLENMVFRPLTAISVSIWVAFGLCCFFSLLTGLIAINRCIKLYQLYHRDEVNIPLLEPDT